MSKYKHYSIANNNIREDNNRAILDHSNSVGHELHRLSNLSRQVDMDKWTWFKTKTFI